MKFNIKKQLSFSLTMRYLLMFSMILIFECEAAPLRNSAIGDYISCAGVKCVCNGRWKRSLRIQSCCTCLGKDTHKSHKGSIEDDKNEPKPPQDVTTKVIYDTSGDIYNSYEIDDNESDEGSISGPVSEEESGNDDKVIEIEQNEEKPVVDTNKKTIGNKDEDLSYESSESFIDEPEEKQEKVIVENIDDNVIEIEKEKKNTHKIGSKDTDIKMTEQSDEDEVISDISDVPEGFKDGRLYYESGDEDEKLDDSSPMIRKKKKEKKEMTTVDIESEDYVIEKVEIPFDSAEKRSGEKEENSNEKDENSSQRSMNKVEIPSDSTEERSREKEENSNEKNENSSQRSMNKVEITSDSTEERFREKEEISNDKNENSPQRSMNKVEIPSDSTEERSGEKEENSNEKNENSSQVSMNKVEIPSDSTQERFRAKEKNENEKKENSPQRSMNKVEIPSDSTEESSGEKEENSNEKNENSFQSSMKPRRSKKHKRKQKDNKSNENEASTNRRSKG